MPELCLALLRDARVELGPHLGYSCRMLLIEQLLQGPSVIIKEAFWGYASSRQHKLQVATRKIERVQGFHLVRVELLFVWINFGLLWRRQGEELEERAPLEHGADGGINSSPMLREFLLREDIS